jgi:hypothetical protein
MVLARAKGKIFLKINSNITFCFVGMLIILFIDHFVITPFAQAVIIHLFLETISRHFCFLLNIEV